MVESLLCPCGSEVALAECCQPYVLGVAAAPTAEALMRSRYTAYCNGNVDYLVETLHPAKRRLSDRASLTKSSRSTTWLGLTIVHTERGQPDDDEGVVEFVAVYRAGEVHQLHERSRFQKHRGRWFYVDGDHLPPLQPSRNAPCWCGSGKKFKQCHGR